MVAPQGKMLRMEETSAVETGSAPQAERLDTSTGAMDKRQMDEADLAEIREHFTRLLDLIPAQNVLIREEDAEASYPSKRKMTSNSDKKAAKRAKLNPETFKSVSQLQMEAFEAKEAKESRGERGLQGTGKALASDSKPLEDAVNPAPVLHPRGKAKNAAELQARLQARIEEIRANRARAKNERTPAAAASLGEKGASTTDTETDVPGKNTREALLEYRRLKREAQRASLRSQKKKKKRAGKDKNAVEMSATVEPGSEPSAESISYGKMQVDADPRPKKKHHTVKDQLSALEREKKERERVLALADEQEKANIEQKEAFDKALKQASGEKVFDNTQLLKQNLKRREHAKKVSAKTWDDRMKKNALEHKERDAKRAANIQARRGEKKKGKKDKGKKAGKMSKPRPGFEGTIRSGGKSKRS